MYKVKGEFNSIFVIKEHKPQDLNKNWNSSKDKNKLMEINEIDSGDEEEKYDGYNMLGSISLTNIKY